MLEFKNITFQYNEEQFFDKMTQNLSFSVNDGELVSIIGASGCGKSTIFRLINGLETPQEGKILVGGKDIKTLKNYSAYMPQKDLLFPWRTVGENAALPLELQGMKKEARREKTKEMLEEVGLLAYMDKFPSELSGGMRQRVSFARTLLTGSNLLMLDEPYSALDSLTKISMQEWLLTQWEHFHKTILFITHDVEEAIYISKRIFVIQERPITHMEEIEIPLSYPRDRSVLQLPEIVALKERLIEKLRQEVGM